MVAKTQLRPIEERDSRAVKSVLLTLLTCSLALCAPGLASARHQTADPDPALAPLGACAGDQTISASAAAERASMTCLVNYARRSWALPTLTSSPQLARAAQLKLGDDSRCDAFSHSACGLPRISVFVRSGYLTGARSYHLGENLAWGQNDLGSPRSIMAAWLASPEHRANLLDPRYRELGVAYLSADTFLGASGAQLWVTEFGLRVRAPSQ